MDKYVAPNFNRRETLSSFSEVDAGYIDSAAKALKKAGDVVIVEAQQRALRDHYVKQILAQLLASSPHVLINRCKKDRDWMVAALNQSFVKNKISDAKSKTSRLNEVWILDLSSSEDFGILKLAQTLVSQFEEAGSCVLVSCSSSVTNLREFVRWSNRVGIPVWHFDVPDSSAISAFLEQEAESGAINEARRLVDELQSLDEVDEEESSGTAMKDLRMTDLKEFAMNTSPVDVQKNNGLVTTIKDNSKTGNVDRMVPMIEDGQASLESKTVGELEAKNSKKELNWESVKSATFGFLIMLSAAFAIFFLSDSDNSISDYRNRLESGATSLSSYFSNFKQNDSENSALDEGLGIRMSSDSEKDPVVRDYKKSMRLENQSLSMGGDLSGVAEVSRSEVSKLTLQAEYEQALPLPSNSAKVGDRKSMEYFAQFGAFENKNSALWYKINRGRDFSNALIVTKPSGLWAVVTGPFDSKELAKASVEGREADIYVITASEIILN